MQYFTQGFLSFFAELEKNNNTQWFHANKQRYEQDVKLPLTNLVTDIIEQMQSEGEAIEVTAKDCILRVNRDIRFSKDKSPYNLHCTAFVSRAGRKDKSIPGLFIRLATDEIGIMGGCYQPSTKQLSAIRSAIAKKSDEFTQLIQQQDFVNRFGELRGEQAKRLPKEWQEDVEQQPLLANKQFYFSTMQPAAMLTQNDLLDELMAYWRAARPLNQFLLKALGE